MTDITTRLRNMAAVVDADVGADTDDLIQTLRDGADTTASLLEALEYASEVLATAERLIPADGNKPSLMAVEQTPFEEAVKRMVDAIASARGERCSMADFITLTLANDGNPSIRFAANHIVAYRGCSVRDEKLTAIYDVSGGNEPTYVTETPEQIDAMLGVKDSAKANTADDIAMALEIEGARLSTDAEVIHNSSMRDDTQRRSRAFRDAAQMARDIIAKAGA